jgi:hypothetical protein
MRALLGIFLDLISLSAVIFLWIIFAYFQMPENESVYSQWLFGFPMKISFLLTWLTPSLMFFVVARVLSLKKINMVIGAPIITTISILLFFHKDMVVAKEILLICFIPSLLIPIISWALIRAAKIM